VRVAGAITVGSAAGSARKRVGAGAFNLVVDMLMIREDAAWS